MHECYAMQILETKKTKTKKPKNNGHKEYSNEAQGPRKIRNTESHQLLDEVSQTYFCREVW